LPSAARSRKPRGLIFAWVIKITIKRQPFRKYNLEDCNSDIVNVRLNPQERAIFLECKVLLQQPKDSTTLKMLALIGAENVLRDASLRLFISLFFKNRKNNDIQGVIMPEPELEQNVTQKKGVL
jgi:hypothetical protein